MNSAVVGAIIATAGVVVGAVLSFAGGIFTAKRNEKLADKVREADRYDQAVAQIRSAMAAIRFMKPELHHRDAPGPNLYHHLHTIDSYVYVFKSEELRHRLNAATSIMGNWDWFSNAPFNPIWVAANHAEESLGAFLRDEPLPQEAAVFRHLREEVEWVEQQAEEHLAETDSAPHP